LLLLWVVHLLDLWCKEAKCSIAATQGYIGRAHSCAVTVLKVLMPLFHRHRKPRKTAYRWALHAQLHIPAFFWCTTHRLAVCRAFADKSQQQRAAKKPDLE